jgi:thioredoxin 2
MTDTLKLTCLSCGQANRIPADKLKAGPKCARCGALLADGDVAEINVVQHDKAVRTDDLPLIVDYWAPWCGPCRMMAPEFAKAAKALRNTARFAKINTEDFPQVSARLQIRGIPLLIRYDRGHEAKRLSGARPAAEIESFARGRS